MRPGFLGKTKFGIRPIEILKYDSLETQDVFSNTPIRLVPANLIVSIPELLSGPLLCWL
jgi:hypothetical protein